MKTRSLPLLLVPALLVVGEGGLEAKPSGLELPEGFSLAEFAKVPGARSMTRGPKGTIFVGTRGSKVYAVRDTDGDGRADSVKTLLEGLEMPNGVAVKGGDLYVAEVSKITRYPDIEDHLDAPKGEPWGPRFPTDRHHGWKYIAFGPDGWLYVPVGAPCNICEPDLPYASITRVSPDGKTREIWAKGVRNSVGFSWHPETKVLWFTDNGRDHLGDNEPDCELNRAPKAGLHFGYPYCHSGDVPDPKYGDERPCKDFVAPAAKLGPHVAPLGVAFYRGAMFPKAYKGRLFIAQHGSWNRSEKIGYRVMQVEIEDGKVKRYAPFVTGWLDQKTGEVSGRPVDVFELPDGSVLISDDSAGRLWRVTYSAD